MPDRRRGSDQRLDELIGAVAGMRGDLRDLTSVLVDIRRLTAEQERLRATVHEQAAVVVSTADHMHEEVGQLADRVGAVTGRRAGVSLMVVALVLVAAYAGAWGQTEYRNVCVSRPVLQHERAPWVCPWVFPFTDYGHVVPAELR
jgi:hypothetical protein